MALPRFIAAASCLLASAAVHAQSSEPADESIVVEGERPVERPPSVITQLKSIIAEADSNQLARFEMDICPMVVGMPRDLTAALTRLIKANVVAVGGKVGEPGCTVNAPVIFIDNPQLLVRGLYKEEPTFFHTMSPREFYYFAEQPRPAYSWHLTNTYTRDGVYLSKANRQAAATRLYTNIREEIEVGILVIDRAHTEGKTLRQLADFATMHLLLDVKQNAGKQDKSSILSLFEKRSRGAPPPRFSTFDRAALTGFYTQRENNRTIEAQRQNIAAAVEKAKRGEEN